MKKIYINGEYITLENNKCEAILIENEIVSKVGTKEKVLKYADKDTEIIDLEGKTMMPAFIDAHSHFFGVANNFLQISLSFERVFHLWYTGYVSIKRKAGCDFPIIRCPLVLRRRVMPYGHNGSLDFVVGHFCGAVFIRQSF